MYMDIYTSDRRFVGHLRDCRLQPGHSLDIGLGEMTYRCFGGQLQIYLHTRLRVFSLALCIVTVCVHRHISIYLYTYAYMATFETVSCSPAMAST